MHPLHSKNAIHRRVRTLAAAALLVSLSACADSGDGAVDQPDPHGPPPGGDSGPTATQTPTDGDSQTGDASATATEEPTVDALPARCRDGDTDDLDARLAELEADIIETMDGYNGEWSVGMVDLDCDIEFTVHPEYLQYAASAGKIVPVIAALRAVEDGDLDLATVEHHLLPVMEHSLDWDADQINAMVTPEQVQEVLDISGVTESRFEYSWQRTNMPALELARVWGALLDDELLDEEMKEYLLDLATRPDIPDGMETFPLESGLDDFQIGQKAGYWVSRGVPYVLLGAGYLRPLDDSAEADAGHQGVALVFQLTSHHPDLFEPQRRTVYPLLAEYVEGN